MRVKLGDISQLHFGLYAKPVDEGNAVYLQGKHFDKWGNRTEQIDTFIQIDQKNESHLLEEGDILLAGKGMRNFAWTYDKAFGPAIASSIFFVIKVDPSRVIPEYLTTLFNMSQTQTYFQILGTGSSIPSIRKSELEAFVVTLPSLELQQKAITVKELHYKEMELSRKIIFEKQQVYQAVIKNIINQKA
ncbi:restriction endonuclease subunit S [Cyclobacterium jeungdonense]|uniref:Restriction endonuclease subunit S n=1 Tax=Cyclobacterium jeungdonense TaxID=708087 RepID=A0ABT8CD29_9BACT|nr:restriction endonuclease subunit S [Cyclobacterium jeungdonense]MDN3689655.1 restriction endonuclease subunit S [Cyclobacterium jeungdonense]